MNAAYGNLTSSSAWQHPGNHVSAMTALGNRSTCQKLQRVLTREREKTRFTQFWDSLADNRVFRRAKSFGSPKSESDSARC